MVHRIKGITGVSRRKIPTLLIRAWLVYNSLFAATGAYPAPNPSLAILLAAIEALEAAQKLTAGNKSKAVRLVRDAKADDLILILESELVYVQGLGDASPATAASIITGAGFVVPQVPVHTKGLLELALTATPGTILCRVNLTTLAGRGVRKKIQINWSYSVDGGKSWINASSTPLAETEIPNLPLATMVQVRACATVSKVVGAWTAPASIFVH